jgi:hypothetical protein
MSKKQDRKRKDRSRVHGGYAEITRYRERRLDLRSNNDKALKAFADSVVADCGGVENMDTYQVAMLDRATELLIILRCMAAHVEETHVIDNKGQLAPCLRQSFVSYLNSFRLTMESIYSRNDKKPPNVKRLNDLLNMEASEQ